MATKQPKIETTNRKYKTVTWESLAGDDDGQEVAVSEFADKCVQVHGDLGGGTFSLQGSMNGTDWEDLTSDGSTGIAALGMFIVWENPLYIRPLMSGGSGSDVTVILGMSALNG